MQEIRIALINIHPSSQSVAELVMAHLFNISRFVYDSNRQMPKEGSTSFKVLKKKYARKRVKRKNPRCD